MKHKRNIWIMLYCLVLTAFTAYFLLDTFVIARVYAVEGAAASGGKQTEETAGSNQTLSAAPQNQQTDSRQQTAGAESPENDNEQESETTENTLNQDGETPLLGSTVAQNAITKTVTPVITENSYTDENISIVITEYERDDTIIYVADVQLSSAEYLKTALAQGAYGRNVTDETSSIASGVSAILAINGDYYGSQQRGYVIRNGVLYRSTAASGRQDLVIYGDGSFEIITEGQVSAEELLAKGAQQVLSFGPGLVENGKVSVSSSYEVTKAMNSNPRTAIGVIDELHYLLVVADGRTAESEGLSVYELAQFMQSLGVQTAYNLDGGGSSTMYFNGSIVNNPTTNGRTIRERSVSDIVYIGY
ncbi:MAG: phosphodiester glycosidase family protein [Firmicutes bacterium]|nr:phosphodiester glycosidase family protein [Bacillota bacterium]